MNPSKLTIQFVAVLFVTLGVFYPSGNVAATSLQDNLDTKKILRKLNRLLREQENTHCAIPPTWSELIPGHNRFVPTSFVDENGDPTAYCDLQTGLVWEAEPDNVKMNWTDALKHCIDSSVSWSGQKGGRLPSIPEMASLVDINSSTCPGVCLPDGHPFIGVEPKPYWSASTYVNNTERAWDVDFQNGRLFHDGKNITWNAWCVRGPMNTSVY